MLEQKTLGELAAIVRSKNAGPYRLTFDILFDDEQIFRNVVDSGAVSRESVANAFGIDDQAISSMHTLPHGLAIKFTLYRPRPQCSPGESDVYGCQHHAPLLDLPVPVGGNYANTDEQ
ncbi:MAG: hypothetical protein CMO26_08095 [Thiotrichales bacterium]|nr:hypothetical protein [Thiotrichales bacterium]|tara:strand:- start:808 stop:1161 length:354 start_codon:yes stop_codon:yes gene_type:complete